MTTERRTAREQELGQDAGGILLPLKDRPPKKDEDGKDIHVRFEDLKEGDVLFSYGNPEPGGLSWWIRKADRSWYSHSSYFDGEQIVDSTARGVERVDVAVRVCMQHYVDVFRFRSDDGDRLGSNGWPADPVTEAVAKYMGHEYPMYDLVFAGLLVSARRVDLPDAVELWARWLLSRAFLALRQLIFREKKVHLTCVELIYRGFQEAARPPDYRLAVPVPNPDRVTAGPADSLEGVQQMTETLEALAARSELGLGGEGTTGERAGEAVLQEDLLDARLGIDEEVVDEELPALDELCQAFNRLYGAHKSGEIPEIDLDGIAPAEIVAPEPLADFISLFDIERSRNLELVGRAWREDYGCP